MIKYFYRLLKCVLLVVLIFPCLTQGYLIQESTPSNLNINYGLKGAPIAHTYYGSYATGTLGYVKRYIRYTGAGNLSALTLRYRLSSGTLGDRDCYSPTKSLADWGIGSSYGLSPQIITGFTGTQCVINSATDNWTLKIITNVSPTSALQTAGDSGGSSGYVWYRTFSGVPYNLITTNIATNTTWNSADPYLIKGNVAVNSGVTLTINPGVVIKFDTSTSSSLTVNGNLIAHGSSTQDGINYVYFTSFRDDSVPAEGDTNNDLALTTPAAGDWGGVIASSGGSVDLEYAIIRYGGSGNDSLIKNNGGVIDMASSTIAHGTTYGIRNLSGTSTVVASDIGFTDYGLYLSGGSLSVTSSSTIHDNDLYGIYNATTNTINAENNWWATSTGPLHSSLNPGGGGDEVSDYVDFTPWVSDIHYVIDEDCHSYGQCGSTPNSGTLLWDWATSSTPTYTSELNSAISTWNNSGNVSITDATSTVHMWLNATSTDDVIWSGLWDGDIYLNKYYLDQDASSRIQNTITHEFGHALGLNHSYTGNVMHHNQTSLTQLGVQDVIDYFLLWP